MLECLAFPQIIYTTILLSFVYILWDWVGIILAPLMVPVIQLTFLCRSVLLRFNNRVQYRKNLYFYIYKKIDMVPFARHKNIIYQTVLVSVPSAGWKKLFRLTQGLYLLTPDSWIHCSVFVFSFCWLANTNGSFWLKWLEVFRVKQTVCTFSLLRVFIFPSTSWAEI